MTDKNTCLNCVFASWHLDENMGLCLWTPHTPIWPSSATRHEQSILSKAAPISTELGSLGRPIFRNDPHNSCRAYIEDEE